LSVVQRDGAFFYSVEAAGVYLQEVGVSFAELLLIFVVPDPSAFMRKTWEGLSKRVKAIFEPSGDQTGDSSGGAGLRVILVGLLPSACMTQISPSCLYAMRHG
jgi:hypothetical protein